LFSLRALALLLPACGEKVGMRGRSRYAQDCEHTPSPARFARDLSPHAGRGANEISFSRRGRRASGGMTHVERVIARSQRVRPEVAGPMTSSATKQSSAELELFSGEAIALAVWIASLHSQ
jgi:hypothetical protein